jgi:hypothetical protein
MIEKQRGAHAIGLPARRKPESFTARAIQVGGGAGTGGAITTWLTAHPALLTTPPIALYQQYRDKWHSQISQEAFHLAYLAACQKRRQ